jgi:hypothetical protein
MNAFCWSDSETLKDNSKETKIVEEAIYDYRFFDYLPA